MRRQRIWDLAAFAAGQRSVLSERLGSSGAFLIFDRAVSHLFDYGLYPLAFLLTDTYVGGYWGFIVAAIIMTTFSFLICWSWIYLYDFFQVDLLILEDIKRLRNNGTESNSRFKILVANILKKGNFLSFVIMSLKFDPFMTAVFMRPNDDTFGLHGKRDWLIFIGSVLLSNGFWWLPSFFIGTEGFEILWGALQNWSFDSLKGVLAISLNYLGVYLILWHWLLRVSK